MFCTKCGHKLPENAQFCVACGQPVSGASAKPANTPKTPAPTPPQAPAPNAPQPQAPATQAPAPNAPQPQAFRFGAAAVSGEAAYGAIGAAMNAATNALPGPGKVIGAGVKSFFASVGGACKDPKRLIPAVVLAAVWLTLNVLQASGIDPLPTQVVSVLTFAGGGMSGGLLGAVGGIVGKGIFAGAVVALIGLFTRKGGEKRSFGETLKGAFGVDLTTLWGYLAGIGAAMLLYLFISGGATRLGFMGGIAAAFLAARAALSGGFLQKLFGSFTKSKSPSNPSVQGLMRGLSVGFGAAALIGLSNVNLILIIAGSVLLVGGGVMMILQATGVVKRGKGAQAQ